MPPAPARCPVDTPALVLMYKLIAPLAERATAGEAIQYAETAWLLEENTRLPQMELPWYKDQKMVNSGEYDDNGYDTYEPY